MAFQGFSKLRVYFIENHSATSLTSGVAVRKNLRAMGRMARDAATCAPGGWGGALGMRFAQNAEEQ
jgi:hypothetical protein